MVGLFFTIELAFLIANIPKFSDGGYITLLISATYFLIMYCVYSGRRISNKFTRFVDLGKYVGKITELSNDKTFPKFSTHLVYLTKANQRHHIEEKIINSIFSKMPKRADVYWFVHINRTEDPYTLSYSVHELADDKVVKITINTGFRVQTRTEVFFKKIVQELINNKELNMHTKSDGSNRYNSEPDFKFVVIEKFLSVENEFTFKDGIMLNIFFFLKSISQRDERAFGLDKSDVVIEHVPLVYQPIGNIELVRVS